MKEMSIAQFKELAQNCIDDLNVIGIYPKVTLENININRRLTQTFGKCVYTWRKVNNEYDFKTVRIDISYRLLTDEHKMRNTLYHELLHACSECISCHHGGQWKKYAELVTDCYGTSIERCGDWNETTAIKVGKEYSWKCSACGQKFTTTRNRAPKWYMHPKGYTHKNCPCGKGYVMSEYYGYKLV